MTPEPTGTNYYLWPATTERRKTPRILKPRRWLTENQKFAVGAMLVFLGFCAFFGYMKSTHAADPIEYAQACPGRTEGCYDPVKHAIYYPRPEDREHELEHADGMRHGAWASQGGNWPWMCARVTVAGNTHWQVGETICRTPRGEYISGT